MSADLEELAPSLRNVIDQTTLKWVFVGGKVEIEEIEKVPVIEINSGSEFF